MSSRHNIYASVSLGTLFVGVNLALGMGEPRMDIPADAEMGKEYPGPDEARIAQEMLDLMVGSLKETYAGKAVLREAHLHAHGCVHAKVSVRGGLSPELQHGVFAEPRSYDAWIRFSNGGVQRKPDAEGDVRGMAIKLTGVEGPKLLDLEKQTQDFLLITHPVMPMGDPGEYLALFRAALAQRPMGYFFGHLFHWKLGALRTLTAIRERDIPSMLSVRYWSATPYRLGKAAVKYSAKPCVPSDAREPETPAPDYLRRAMVAHLAEKGACFELMVQPQSDAQTTPVEDAAVEWYESASPFVTVAQIEIPKQKFDSPEQDEFCEQLSFDPWHALPAHQPLGALNRVRRVVYQGISNYRHEQNKKPPIEPSGTERF